MPPRLFIEKKNSAPTFQCAPKNLIFIVFNTYFVTFAPQVTHDLHLAIVLCTCTYDLHLLRTRDHVENCHTVQSGQTGNFVTEDLPCAPEIPPAQMQI